jgi:hypothetical protein
MGDRKLRVGALLTAAWLAVMAGFLYWGTRPEKLNEWGDFFAGFFAPLAFLWLVLGYLQQGVELRNSTHALELQAEELKNSVKAQSELVEVSRKQLEQEMTALKEERQLRSDAMRPKIMAALGMSSKTGNMLRQQVQLTNSGGHAWNVHAEIQSAHDPRITDHIQWTSLSTMNVELVFHRNPETIPVRLSMSCQDGEVVAWTFDVTRDADGATVGTPRLEGLPWQQELGPSS